MLGLHPLPNSTRDLSHFSFLYHLPSSRNCRQQISDLGIKGADETLIDVSEIGPSKETGPMKGARQSSGNIPSRGASGTHAN